MDIESLREYCLNKNFVTESFPFDDVSLVMKVGGKMFALLPLDAQEPLVTLKCNPELAIDLREQYSFVEPAFHFNKKHWNMIRLAEAPDAFIRQWIDHSYDLVFAKLTRKERDALLTISENNKG